MTPIDLIRAIESMQAELESERMAREDAFAQQLRREERQSQELQGKDAELATVKRELLETRRENGRLRRRLTYLYDLHKAKEQEKQKEIAEKESRLVESRHVAPSFSPHRERGFPEGSSRSFKRPRSPLHMPISLSSTPRECFPPPSIHPKVTRVDNEWMLHPPAMHERRRDDNDHSMPAGAMEQSKLDRERAMLGPGALKDIQNGLAVDRGIPSSVLRAGPSTSGKPHEQQQPAQQQQQSGFRVEDEPYGARSPGGRYPGERVYNEAFRRKDLRQALPGHACDCCGEFLKAATTDDAERQKIIQECSRHRQYRRKYQTPPDFWEVEFLDEL